MDFAEAIRDLRWHAEVFVGVNLVVVASPKPLLGFSATAMGTVMPLELDSQHSFPPPWGWTSGSWGEGGWVFRQGLFVTGGGSVGAVAPIGLLDCTGYYPIVEGDLLVGYQWSKSGDGMRVGGRITDVVASLEVTHSRSEFSFSLGPSLPLLPTCSIRPD
jgi:hypothetical protein